MLARLNAIPGISISPDRVSSRPSIKLALLKPPDAVDAFIAVWEWYIDQVRETAQS